MRISEIVIIFLLSSWLILNILYAVFNNQLGIYTRRWDIFRWISAYQLFAKTPRYFELYYRNALDNDDNAVWQEILTTPKHKWYHTLLFCPNDVVSNIQSIIDDIVVFEENRNANTKRKITELFIYRVICLFISRHAKTVEGMKQQFKIVEVLAPEGLEKKDIFISDFYTV